MVVVLDGILTIRKGDNIHWITQQKMHEKMEKSVPAPVVLLLVGSIQWG